MMHSLILLLFVVVGQLAFVNGLELLLDEEDTSSIMLRALQSKDKKDKKKKDKKKKKGCKSAGAVKTLAKPILLESFPQWKNSVGYWIGHYSFYQSDGTPFESTTWNHPYDSYMGFIANNIQGLAFRQRSIMLYPPQSAAKCAENDLVVGEGVCGVNGNGRVFFADQVADEKAALKSDFDGSVSGPFAFGVLDTKTELIGNENSLLYQVYRGDDIVQSQLTTGTTDANGIRQRTRSAQSFTDGIPTAGTFFREYQVTEEDFYEILADTLVEYNILESDTCAWQDSYVPPPFYIPAPYVPGLDGCIEHIQQAFDECFYDC